MKKISILSFLLSLIFSQAQDIAFNKLYGNNDPTNYYLGHYPVASSDGLMIKWYGGIKLVTNSEANILQLLGNGNVGIGTQNPQSKLDVDFGGEPKSIKFMEAPNTINTMNSMIRFTWYNENSDIGMIRGGGSNIIGMGFRFNGVEKMRITPQGNLSVSNKIETKEVKVTTSPTADFVFEETYDLPKLDEVEKFIKENKHLPEIASAKVMEKEGVNIGEFQIKLLQKIEELTLYSIEQNKQLKSQAEKIEKLEKHLLQSGITEK